MCIITKQQHEWTTHGICSGTANAADFFTQVCSMSVAPLKVMNATRNTGGSLTDMANALTAAGYEVYSIDTSNSQV
jgi:ribonuclease I